MPTIQEKLNAVGTQRVSTKLVQFSVSKPQFRILRVVANCWGITVAELCRRSINLVFSQIKDKQLLARIKGIQDIENAVLDMKDDDPI